MTSTTGFVEDLAARATQIAARQSAGPGDADGLADLLAPDGQHPGLHRDRASRKARGCSPAASGIPTATRPKASSSSRPSSPTSEPEMKIACEEIFGPVVSAIRFREPEEAVGSPTARSTAWRPPSGRATSGWRTGWRRRSRPARSGSTRITRFDSASPFGGYKQSGYGRDLGAYALEQYTNVKSVWVGVSVADPRLGAAYAASSVCSSREARNPSLVVMAFSRSSCSTRSAAFLPARKAWSEL